MVSESPFHQFVREERFFCSILAHLLLQRGDNLKAFVELVREKRPGFSAVGEEQLERAEIYLEFSYLRDDWEGLDKDNAAKRARIADLLAKVPELRALDASKLPTTIPEFNAHFIGRKGLRIQQDIAFPGNWSVAAIADTYAAEPEFARGICKFKWSFNIKPDLVVMIPGANPISIEAKLESGEGQYPASGKELAIFDSLFGRGNGHVGQLELQQFMFDVLLGSPCESLFLTRNGGSGPQLSWHEVFDRLDTRSSIDFVRRLVEGNRHLRPTL